MASSTLEMVYKKYPTRVSCLTRIEGVRWYRRGPRCPHCHKGDVARKTEKGYIGRWNCHLCGSTFTVLSGMPFNRAKIDLQKWFHAIDLLLNGVRELSSHELGLHLEVNQKTALRIKKLVVAWEGRGGRVRMQKIIGSSKRRYVRRKRKPYQRRRGKPVIT